MAEQTNIEWCDSTVNFWRGCTKVSPGCVNCYAEKLVTTRLKGQWGRGKPRKWSEAAVVNARSFNRRPWICDGCGCALKEQAEECRCVVSTNRKLRRRRIFSLSLGDWLDDEVNPDWLARMLHVVFECDEVIWILCTKRPELFTKRLTAVIDAWPSLPSELLSIENEERIESWLAGNAPAHICVLASVENQDEASKRIGPLLQIPAQWHGLSCEPLLGPLEVGAHLGEVELMSHSSVTGQSSFVGGIDWVIAGGESGHGARACNVNFIRDLVKQAKWNRTAMFVKQLGALPYFQGAKIESTIPIQHPKGADIDEWPQDLRVQQWPKGF